MTKIGIHCRANVGHGLFLCIGLEKTMGHWQGMSNRGMVWDAESVVVGAACLPILSECRNQCAPKCTEHVARMHTGDSSMARMHKGDGPVARMHKGDGPMAPMHKGDGTQSAARKPTPRAARNEAVT